MTTLRYTLELASDAEPGSGRGTHALQALVPRDSSGRPYLPASHLKGLLRDRLREIEALRGWRSGLSGALFGEPGEGGDDGATSAILLTDAHVEDGARVSTRVRARTALSDLGTVDALTLRVSEGIPVGTRFSGELSLAAHPQGALLELGARLALLTLDAVGAGRTRGCGACLVRIDGERRSPGELLRALDAALREAPAIVRKRPVAGRRALEGPAGEVVALDLVFASASGVCCPATPAVASNVLRSDFAIPASAVQGAILERLGDVSPDLATQTFHDPRFRATPLLPCALRDAGTAALPRPVRVSLSHRMSKVEGEGGAHDFRDAAIEPYDWRDVRTDAPLKAADGVLLSGADGAVRLWRARDMPRLFTAHGVHTDPAGGATRNVYAVEAMAPMVFRGSVALPAAASAALLESLEREPRQAIGKARSVRGLGRLSARPIPPEEACRAADLGVLTGRVFVLQSPAAIPDDWEIREANRALAQLVEASGFGRVLPRVDPGAIATMAQVGVRFGWNRLGLGRTVGAHHRLRARRVFLPGSVFVLEAPVPDLPRACLRGLGVALSEGGDVDGRVQGFGAVAPHPGIARALYREEPVTESVRSDEAGKLALELFASAGSPGPSPSQIGELSRRAEESGEEALAYLASQEQRTDRFAGVWRGVAAKLREVLARESAPRALRTWKDLASAARDAGAKGGR